MAERKLTGKLKTSKTWGFKIAVWLLAILFCLPFLMQMHNLDITFAVNESADFSNVKNIQISSVSNASRKTNKTLVDKSTGEFFEGYVYFPNVDSDGFNKTISLSVDEISLEAMQSLYLWVFIPEVIVQNLVIVAAGGGNSLTWQIKGVDLAEETGYELSLVDMIIDYGGKLTRGWKLLELAIGDAMVTGSALEKINSISISYSAEYAGNSNFAITNLFLADKSSQSCVILEHQEYVVYSEKQTFLDKQTSIYVGDKIEINKQNEIFSYAIVGTQNVLEDSLGYVWNVSITSPSGERQTFGLDRKLEVDVLETGYYLIDVTLTTSDQDVYPLISKMYNIYAEPFVFGYFQKRTYDFEVSSQNMVVFNLSKDFTLTSEDTLKIESSDKNTADATYYIEDDKIYINIKTLKVGSVVLTISAEGLKTNNAQTELYDSQIKINVTEEKKDTNIIALWTIFGVMLGGFGVYLIISFVKARKFGVK